MANGQWPSPQGPASASRFNYCSVCRAPTKAVHNEKPGVQLDRVLLCECDHRADELIGLEVDVSGEFITEFELVSVQEP